MRAAQGEVIPMPATGVLVKWSPDTGSPITFLMKLSMSAAAMAACALQFHPGEAYAAPARRWQGIPGIERTPRGRLWATWYSGGETEGPDNYVLLVSSEDDGETWSQPVLAIDPPGQVRAFDPCLWMDPLGRLWLFWAQCDYVPGGSLPTFDGRGGVWAVVTETPDAAEPRWSKPRRLCDGIMMNKPAVLSNGEWLLPVAIWKGADTDSYPVPAEERLAFIVASVDAGDSWQRRGGVDMPHRTFDEHMIVEKQDGALWMLVRRDDGIGESFSGDGGLTWSPGDKTALTQPDSRFFIQRLQSGNLLLVKHHHYRPREDGGDGRSHLTAVLSFDDGDTWPAELLLDRRDNISYPDGVQATDGRIFVIYDRERTGSAEILMAIVHEDDIRAGKLVHPGSQLQKLVNKIS